MEFLDGISGQNGNESSKFHQRYIHISIEDVPIKMFKIRDSSSSDPDFSPSKNLVILPVTHGHALIQFS